MTQIIWLDESKGWNICVGLVNNPTYNIRTGSHDRVIIATGNIIEGIKAQETYNKR